jgi:hypothetical protein
LIIFLLGFGSRYAMDVNGSRRKNATRETTSTLKAWLAEHKKNPYPTKGEKIMLAIITKMTLTQVSTWFANARRRLKKENKMTWEPRNRPDDDDDVDVSDSEPETSLKKNDDQGNGDVKCFLFVWLLAIVKVNYNHNSTIHVQYRLKLASITKDLNDNVIVTHYSKINCEMAKCQIERLSILS